jgi:hypothetical protein
VCIYIYIYIHTHTHTRTHARRYVYMRVCVYVCIYTHTYRSRKRFPQFVCIQERQVSYYWWCWGFGARRVVQSWDPIFPKHWERINISIFLCANDIFCEQMIYTHVYSHILRSEMFLPLMVLGLWRQEGRADLRLHSICTYISIYVYVYTSIHTYICIQEWQVAYH